MKIVFRLIVAAALIATWVPTAARAQGTSSRPYRALFGGATTDPGLHHTLDVTFPVGEAYDDNALADAGGAPVGSILANRVYTALGPTVAYAWLGRRAQLVANGTGAFRYYAGEGKVVSVNRGAAIGFSATVGRNTQVMLTQSATYAPALFHSLLPSLSTTPGQIVDSGADYALNSANSVMYDTSASVTVAPVQRSSFSAVAGYHHGSFSTLNQTGNLRGHNLGARYSYGLSRYARLHAGYVYRTGGYGVASGNDGVVVHDVDTGIDYGRPLSFSRRTRIEFSTGSSIVTTPLGGAEVANTLQYRLRGHASLSHDMGRTWQARLVYERGVGFVEGFRQPVFSDALNASLDGFLSRRVDVHAGGGFSVGEVGAAASAGFRTYTSTVRTRFAVNSIWAVYGEYLYYHYDLASLAIVPDGLPPVLSRNTVRAGIALWVPLLRR